MSEAKRYLKRLTRKRLQIKTLEGQIAYLESIVHSSPLKAVTYDRDVVQTSHTGSEGTEKIEELVDMQAKLFDMKASLVKDMDKAREEIWRMPTDRYMEMLSCVYLEGNDLAEAAEDLDISYDRAKHIHGEALAEFQRVILDPRKKVEFIDE